MKQETKERLKVARGVAIIMSPLVAIALVAGIGVPMRNRVNAEWLETGKAIATEAGYTNTAEIVHYSTKDFNNDGVEDFRICLRNGNEISYAGTETGYQFEGEYTPIR